MPKSCSEQCSNHRKYGPNCDQTCPCIGARCYNNGTCTQCFKTYIGQKCEICVCQNGGTCDDDQCLCHPNFTGVWCEIRNNETFIRHQPSFKKDKNANAIFRKIRVKLQSKTCRTC